MSKLCQEIIFDYDNLYDLAEKNKEKFQKAEPFQHIMFDNFLNYDSYRIIKHNYQGGKNASGPDERRCTGKFGTEDSIPDYKKIILYEFGCPNFIKFLNTLTGIDDLQLDPTFLAAGYVTIRNGGYLQPHRDFTHNRRSGLERRINLFIYLNDVWQEEWKGALCLFDLNGNKIQSYLPMGNRCVIFQCTDKSYHGHPEKLSCPENMSRQSLSFYYYSEDTGTLRDKIHFLNEELNNNGL